MTDGIAGDLRHAGSGRWRRSRHCHARSATFRPLLMADWVCGQLALGLIEVLQRRHGAGIGVDAKRHLVSPFWCSSIAHWAFCPRDSLARLVPDRIQNSLKHRFCRALGKCVPARVCRADNDRGRICRVAANICRAGAANNSTLTKRRRAFAGKICVKNIANEIVASNA